MKTTFWLEEKSPKQFFATFLKAKGSKHTLWDIFANYEPNYRNDDQKHTDEDAIDEFDYPVIGLAYSNTFYGFNNDAGHLSYDEQEHIVNHQFEQYKNEISELLQQQPDSTLQPTLDYAKLDADEVVDSMYWRTLQACPFMYEFEGQFTAWKTTEKVLFLSVNKGDRELPYEIIIGGLTLKKYNKLLNQFNKITG